MMNKYLIPAAVLCIALAGSGMAATTQKTTVTTVLTFAETNGAYPFDGLTYDGNDTLYGAAFGGGKYGYGVVYQLTESGSGAWTPAIVHSFEDPTTEGANPYGTLLLGSDGQIFGTTAHGGTNGLGAVFELTPPLQQGGPWALTLLYSFGSAPNDGIYPYSGLVMDKNGILYGTTVSGGGAGQGTVYSLTPSGGNWTEKVLYSFAGGADASNPYATLTMSSTGTLYGTAPYGGTTGSGAVFALMPGAGGSWSESLLCAFPGGTGGANPYGGVMIGASGGLYGATTNGGSQSAGTIYRCTQSKSGSWNIAVLYNMPSFAASYSTLVTDSTGALYGTTPGSHGNSSNDGIVFKLSPPATQGGSWTPSTLYAFPGALGNGPRAGLTWGPNGTLFGATVGLGSLSIGTVFQMTF